MMTSSHAYVTHPSVHPGTNAWRHTWDGGGGGGRGRLRQPGPAQGDKLTSMAFSTKASLSHFFIGSYFP